MSRSAEAPRSRQGRATRIRDLLRSQILVEAADFKLPSEEELAREHGVSRNTMREALSLLVDEGLLRRRRGIGTQLVVERTDRVYGGGSCGLAESMPQLAPRISHLHIDLEIVPATPYLRRCFGPGEDFFVYWERVTLVGREPQSVWRSHLPARTFASIVADPPPAIQTIYDTVRAITGQHVARIRRTVEARAADPVTARHLRVPSGAPALHIERTMFSPEGRPWELGYAWARSERYAVTYDTDLDA
jgi:GntR family transcriptional regulator